MPPATEDTPLLSHPVPVVLKPCRYNFADKDGLVCHGVYDRYHFWFLNLGLLSCYVVCGLIIAALSASIENIADNVNRQSTDIASVYVARGLGSIIGSFASAPIFNQLNAVQSLVYAYCAATAVMIWIPHIYSLVQLHTAYFLIGGLTSLVSAGSILLLRKIHKEHAGPWLGALGAALVSAGIVVPVVQMVVPTFRMQFFIYAVIIVLGAVWLKVLPFIPEDIHTSRSGEIKAAAALKVSESSENHEATAQNRQDAFFMTSVACASTVSSSSLYCSIVGNSVSHRCSIGNSHEAGLMQLGINSVDDFGRTTKDRRTSIGVEEDMVGEDIDIEADCSEHMIEQVVHVEDGTDDLSSEALVPPHYWTDMLISLMVLFIVGGGTSFSIYIETYVQKTEVINPGYKAMVLMVFFCSGTVANISGIFMQISIGDNSLSRLTSFMLSLGAVGVALILLFPNSPNVLWSGVSLFGFASAITVGFCFNIANRLSFPSATSTSIIMIGSSVGVSIVPYITSVLISKYENPIMVMVVGLVSSSMPIVLLYLAISSSYMAHKF